MSKRLYTAAALTILALLAPFGGASAASLATLLPNGKQCFYSSAGTPLAAGSVYFYIPNTTTNKNTWQDAGQTTLNTDPVTLDSSGCALIYGSGTYRQVLKDSLGNTIWDQATDQPATAVNTQGGTYLWGGVSTGTANNYNVTLSPAPTVYADGQTFRFTAGQTNTGAAYVNVNSLGSEPVYEITQSGVIPTNSSDIQRNQVVVVTYSSALSGFQLVVPPATSAPVQQVPPGTIIAYAGNTAPAGWLFANTQAVSRTTYSNLYAAITIAQSGFVTGGTTISGLADTTNMGVGDPIESAACPSSTTIATIASSSSITVSQSCTNGSANVVVFPFGDGDGSTTFNVPDLRGRFAAGVDNMAGIGPAGRLGNNSSAGGISGTASLGMGGGAQTHTQTIGELVSHSHAISTNSGTCCTAGDAPAGSAGPTLVGYGGGIGQAISNTGGGGAMNITPPVLVVNYLIKT